MTPQIINSKGFDLYEVTENEWILDTKTNEMFTGTFVEVATYAIMKYGFDINTIEFAIKEMVNNNHNGAHFGMHREFFYSFHMDFTKQSVAC